MCASQRARSGRLGRPQTWASPCGTDVIEGWGRAASAGDVAANAEMRIADAGMSARQRLRYDIRPPESEKSTTQGLTRTPQDRKEAVCERALKRSEAAPLAV